jgi:RimJ/RimL family protein N-acetyltransferase
MNPHAALPDVLSTARLSLRRYDAGDARALHALVARNRAHLSDSFPEMALGQETIAAVAAFIESKSAQWKAAQSFCYGLWRTDSNSLAGQIQVKNVIWNVPAAELSYFIATDSLRLGFATEAISRVLQVLFTELEFTRVHVRVIASNAASLALAAALGFRAEGLHRQEFRCGLGKLHDVQHLSIISGDSRPML